MKKILPIILIAFCASAWALVTDTPTTSAKWSTLTWSVGFKPGGTELFCNKTNIKDTCDIDTTLGGVLLNQRTGGADIFNGRTIHVLNNWLDTTKGIIEYPTSLYFDNATSATLYSGYLWNGYVVQQCTVFVNTPKLTMAVSGGTTTAYTFAALRIGTGDTVSLSCTGGGIVAFSGYNGLVMNNGMLTWSSASATLDFWHNNITKGKIFSFTGSPTINGTSSWRFYFGNNNQFDTIPAFTYTGTGNINYGNIFGYTGCSFIWAGNQIYSGGMSALALASVPIDCKTYALTFNGSSNATFTTGGTQLYYDVIGSGTNKITQTGNLLCKNDLTLSAGQKWIMPSGGLDSVGRDFTRSTTDSLIRNGNTLKIGRNHVSTGSGPVINDNAAIVEYCGSAAAHNVTAGTGRMGSLRLVDNGSVTQLSRLWCNYLNDSAGKWYTNGYSLVVDSLLRISDSIYTAAADSIIDSGSVVLSATSKPNLAGILSFVGNANATITGGGSAKSLGRVHLNKGSNGVTTSGVTAYDTLFVDDGTLALGDTAYCNVLKWSATDSSTLAKPIVVANKIIVAAGAKIGFSGTGKLLMTTCVQATLNGNPVVVTYPAGCSFVSGKKHRGLGLNTGLIIGIDQQY